MCGQYRFLIELQMGVLVMKLWYQDKSKKYCITNICSWLVVWARSELLLKWAGFSPPLCSYSCSLFSLLPHSWSEQVFPATLAPAFPVLLLPANHQPAPPEDKRRWMSIQIRSEIHDDIKWCVRVILRMTNIVNSKPLPKTAFVAQHCLPQVVWFATWAFPWEHV